jgi:hypothetical protein
MFIATDNAFGGSKNQDFLLGGVFALEDKKLKTLNFFRFFLDIFEQLKYYTI